MTFNKTKNIYAYTTTFTINTEKDLDDLWSYCIFRLNLENSEYTYDRFARLYNFLNDNKKLLSPMNSITISLKESSDEYFLVLETAITSILNEFMRRLTIRNFFYTYKENTLSYSIHKKSPQSTIKTKQIEVKKYNVYNFISHEDLTEMTDCIEKMQDSNYEKAYKTLSIDEVNAYRTTLSYYSSFLKMYSQLNTMSSIVAELSVILSLYNNECLKLKNDFRKLLQSFVSSLWYWQEKLFISGGEELHFMDDSFKADLSQIKMMLNLYDEVINESSSCALDDIFDF